MFSMTARSTLAIGIRPLWASGMRSGLAVLEQGLTSGGGLILNLFLARWLAPLSYGAFAVAYTCLLFAAGFHNALLLEPMSVIGPASYSGRLPGYFVSQLKVHLVLVGILSALLLLGGAGLALREPHDPLTQAVLGGGIALPPLLLFWLARRMVYVLQRPATALFAGAFHLLLILCGLIWLHRSEKLNTFTAFLLLGVAGLLSSLLLLRIAGVAPLRPGEMAAPARTAVLKENWTYGRWLVGSTVLYSVSSQVQTLLAAWLLGLEAAGVLRAMQLPMLVATQVVTAIAVLELPSLSYEFGRGDVSRLRRKSLYIVAFLTAIAGLYDVRLFAAAELAERLLFGGKYSTYAWLIPILGLIPVFTGFGTGCSIALRAVQRPQFDLIANSLAAVVGPVSAIVFIRLWGVGGAAGSMVLSFALIAAVTFYFYRIWIPADSAPRISQ